MSDLIKIGNDTPETFAMDTGIYGYSDLLRQFRALLELSQRLERECIRLRAKECEG